MRRGVRIAGLLLAVVGIWLFGVWPPPVWYRTHWPAETAFMRAVRRGGPRQTPRLYRPVPLDSIARVMPEAVLIGEDQRFYDHNGIDYLALAHALGYRRQSFSWSSARDRRELMGVLPKAWSRRDRLRGASTVTQQLAKNLYFSSARNPLRKVKEAVTAYRLELALGKSRVLELYLNVAELGENTWGVEAASRRYFRKSAARLSREQAAALAGCLPFPTRSNPGFRPGRMRWRQQLILRRMKGERVEVPPLVHEEKPLPPDSAAPDSVPDLEPADSLPPSPLIEPEAEPDS